MVVVSHFFSLFMKKFTEAVTFVVTASAVMDYLFPDSPNTGRQPSGEGGGL